MQCITGTFVFFAISLAVVHAEDNEICFSLKHSIPKGCCKFDKKPDESIMKEIWKECVKEATGQPCEIETCFAKKRGFLSGDDTIDKEKAIAEVAKNIDNKELVDTIKEKCIEQDLAEYGPSDMCPVRKIMHCVMTLILSHCPEWSEKGSCQEMKKTVEECSKLIP